MSILDFSLPISDLLRESTKQAHDEIEHSAGAIALLKGELPKEEYVRFLVILWHIYDEFEKALERHATHPVLEPTYNPQLLSRTASLAADISHLLQVPESSWKSHPVAKTLIAKPPPAMLKYIAQIQEVSNSNDPSPLLAHSYVRYLGDLSGGQTIKRVLGKAYGLDDELDLGVSFFSFRELRSSKAASQGEMKRIKEWFRAGMNKGVGDDLEVKTAVVAEADSVFHLNRDVFEAIQISEGNVSNLPKDVSPEEGNYNVANVAAVILAVGLGHFLLTVGGFTGSRGYSKFIGFYEWLESIWTSSSV
ncbi:hypothetical protein C8J56DRAFT_1010751 [Mycena floridula]|nr:hypothetical protein C8J56DRAFT_1010751 [Mycena floridula]